MQREVRVGEQELEKARAADHRTGCRLDGHDRCRARAAVERHFADVFARAVEGDDDFPPGGIARVDLHAPRKHDEEGIAGFPLVDDDRALRIAADDAGRGDAALARPVSCGHERRGSRSLVRACQSYLRMSSMTLPSLANWPGAWNES